ncbi:hypothetical protein Tco_1307013 [Tanacetum coccineum]
MGQTYYLYFSQFLPSTCANIFRMCEEVFRYKLSISNQDENKVQAKKPLLAMIEEYYSVADTHQPRYKKELIKACKEVEQNLEAHSPMDFDQIDRWMCEAVEKKVEATKPLLAMIEEYPKKDILINACAEVEQCLSGHSPENYDPIGWSTFIKNTMDIFKRTEGIPDHMEAMEDADLFNLC